MRVLQLFTFSLYFGHFEPLVQGAFTIGFRVQGVISENGHRGCAGQCPRSSSSSQVPPGPIGPLRFSVCTASPPGSDFRDHFLTSSAIIRHAARRRTARKALEGRKKCFQNFLLSCIFVVNSFRGCVTHPMGPPKLQRKS